MKRLVLNKIEDIKILGDYVRSLDYTKPFIVEIKLFKKSKTDEQRNWWHTMISIYANEVGYTPAEMKEALKQEILGVKEVMLGNKVREVSESSEKQNRETYTRLIDETYRLAAEDGIQLPPPIRDNKG